MKLDRARIACKTMVARYKYPGSITIDDVQRVYENNIKKYGTLTCYLCMNPIKFLQDSLEHKISKSNGGTNNFSNLAVAHITCNNRKHCSAKVSKDYFKDWDNNKKTRLRENRIRSYWNHRDEEIKKMRDYQRKNKEVITMSRWLKKILATSAIILISCSSAYADVISVPAFSADSGVSHLNTFRTTIVDVINGNIEGGGASGAVKNIKADSVSEIEMYDDANPRLRDSEVLGIGVDTFAAGTLTQNTFVYSGGVVPDSAGLTSTITACVAYINGYRVSKAATLLTFTASMDNYVDLSQNGTCTISTVSVGATQPTVTANSARLSKVTTDGTEITAVTDLARRSLSGLVVPLTFRTGLIVSKDSTTTIRVLPGTAEINSLMVSKTSPVTLTISTAGDWAGGSSLRAASTYAYVGMDASGNLKLHTTAPAFDNYAVSATGGKKRYSTWSSTVYRILGWFYMDGAQLVENASNIKEGDVANIIQSQDTSVVAGFADTAFITNVATVNYYSSGGPLSVSTLISGDSAASLDSFETTILRGSTNIAGSGAAAGTSNAGKMLSPSARYVDYNRPQGTQAYNMSARVSGSSVTFRRRALIVEEN